MTRKTIVPQYDAGHKFCNHTAGQVRWEGDPARGEFLPREKRKPRRKGKR